ncbi:MAG: phycobilisome protein [Merismopedia sp. SIO2A8]|nr:phycobilisome protein [Merismopedia sp. SIO2A8]
MLNQCNLLIQKTEGRYATDAELVFMIHYFKSYPQRLSLYQKLQTLEQSIVQAVYEQMKDKHPHLLQSGTQNISGKWKRDTMRTIKYAAIALLLDDPATFQERYLLWFQSIMVAFKSQKSCEVTYSIMQEVIQKLLSAEDFALFSPILELTRTALGGTAVKG